MKYHVLNESPIHVIDALRKLVNSGNFGPDVAIMFLCIFTYVSKMSGYSDDVRHKIAMSSAKDSIVAMSAVQKMIPEEDIERMVQAFEKGEKVKILRDLDHIESKLKKLYDESHIKA